MFTSHAIEIIILVIIVIIIFFRIIPCVVLSLFVSYVGFFYDSLKYVIHICVFLTEN